MTFILIIILIIVLPFWWRKAIRDLAMADRPYRTITKPIPNKKVAKPPVTKP